MDNFHTTLFLSGQIWSKCQNKFGRARPGPAGPGLTKGLRRIGADLHENRLFIEKLCFMPILVISGPSRPQNGSGSKFYAGKWYRELWKPKIKLFHAKSVICLVWKLSAWILCENCPWLVCRNWPGQFLNKKAIHFFWLCFVFGSVWSSPGLISIPNRPS